MGKATLQARMREWMSAQTRPFYFGSMCIDLGFPPGLRRDFVLRTLEDFMRRGEVQKGAWIPCDDERVRGKIMAGYLWGPSYTYNHPHRRSTEAPAKKRILRAMRLISFRDAFSVAEVQTLASAPARSYVDLLIRKLAKEKRSCSIRHFELTSISRSY